MNAQPLLQLNDLIIKHKGAKLFTTVGVIHWVKFLKWGIQYMHLNVKPQAKVLGSKALHVVISHLRKPHFTRVRGKKPSKCPDTNNNET